MNLIDMNLSSWEYELNSNQKCTNYRLFKAELKVETYLVEPPYPDAITVYKFRYGNHKLSMSAGRFRIESAAILCSKCGIGDELHYLFLSLSLSNARGTLLKHNSRLNPNTYKIEKLKKKSKAA